MERYRTLHPTSTRKRYLKRKAQFAFRSGIFLAIQYMGTQNMEFRLPYGAFQPDNKAVIDAAMS